MKSIDLRRVLSVMTVASMVIWTVSCNEEVGLEAPGDQEVGEAQTDVIMEASFEEVEDLAFAGIFSTSELGGRIEEDGRLACASKSAVQTDAGFIVTIDFGSDGCEGPDGRVRKGVITITHDGNIWNYGSAITIELSNYFVNDHLIEGTRTIVNRTTDTSVGVVHEITLENGKVTWPDETFATREVNRTRTWIRDANNPSEDELWIEGSASGINRNGVAYSVEITQKIVFRRDCRVVKVFIPVSGTKQIITGDRAITVDYGNGTCDRFATVTMNGQSKVVTLKELGSN